MINYIKSELYRTVRNHNVHMFIGVIALIIVGLISVFACFSKSTTGGILSDANTSFVFKNMIFTFDTMICLLLGYIYSIEGEENKFHTLKNSVSFGISRTKIYISKQITGAVVSLITYVIINILLIGVTYLFLDNGDSEFLLEYIKASVVYIPLFLATLSIGYAFLLNINNQILSMFVCLGVLMLTPSLLKLLSIKFDFFFEISEWCIYELLKAKNIVQEGNSVVVGVWQSSQGVFKSIISGLVHIVAFNICGLIFFNRKEIK